MESEVGVMHLQSKECLGPPEAEREKKRSCQRNFRGSMAWSTPWFQTSRLHKNETINFCCFMPPSLSYFVKAVPLGNSHGRASIVNTLSSQPLLSAQDFPSISNISLISGQSGQNKKGRSVYPPALSSISQRFASRGVNSCAFLVVHVQVTSGDILCFDVNMEAWSGSHKPITDMW